MHHFGSPGYCCHGDQGCSRQDKARASGVMCAEDAYSQDASPWLRWLLLPGIPSVCTSGLVLAQYSLSLGARGVMGRRQKPSDEVYTGAQR
ncbi:hypothetical protein NDU88_003860 [Pleurodeles waltl]|uniref:Uncharacterized protein n=1 Tax=Pleurodeles waltl TaxID=8319 RepID=A0AAV7L712_PLEWA|nr:hypothetical protein NDU88_003860 [Pleurodeles waltl]